METASVLYLLDQNGKEKKDKVITDQLLELVSTNIQEICIEQSDNFSKS